MTMVGRMTLSDSWEWEPSSGRAQCMGTEALHRGALGDLENMLCYLDIAKAVLMQLPPCQFWTELKDKVLWIGDGTRAHTVALPLHPISSVKGGSTFIFFCIEGNYFS
ncbi:hypothetical protein IFM89_015822 [Coptis chinensis]|uniref:Uncharacterized protein n=1 Tax=Coptis chinensis TaxID=261450 RepID=A0A835INF4_9MAGN|nr:hypothetical protein IFM89_015822 [Coptis chinensis]